MKVLSWNADHTVLRLEDTDSTLKDKLRWPEDERGAEERRESCASAFKLQSCETVRTSKDLAVQLARLAEDIRDRVNAMLAIESERGELRKLYKAFQEALIDDLSLDDFADMYAQTIAYGLLSASISQPSGALVVDHLKDIAPHTNPFLKELMQTFLTVGGRARRLDFDEPGINEVVELLRRTQMDEVLKDFGAKNPQEDPVIHFYELFLKEYDPEKRMKRGVFYTPRPVVTFIVRSVDEILRTEFKLEDGLADTTTWGEMQKRHEGLIIPQGVKTDEPFVQILDPATGTGTFLVEVIDRIYETMRAKWKREGQSEREMYDLWNDYVPRHLLPRLHGFELMMAPYSIAHMKVGLKLTETHYSFLSSERARIYLTNTLEEPKDFSSYFEQMSPALAHEAAAANKIKSSLPVTVVIGNPPYSKVSSNMGEWASSLLKLNSIDGVAVQSYYEVNGAPLGERKVWLQDDYVKFLRIAQYYIRRTGHGVLGYITNHGFLGNPTFNGLRQSLMGTFDSISAIDLHGDSNVGEALPTGLEDENVFDIQQGVAISIMRRRFAQRSSISYSDVWGTREQKYHQLLASHATQLESSLIVPASYLYLFVPVNNADRDEFECSWLVTEAMDMSSSGIVTSRDGFVIGLNDDEIHRRVRFFLDVDNTNTEVTEKLGLSENYAWRVADARKALRADENWTKKFIDLQYRPFDRRRLIYHPAIVWRIRREVTEQMISMNNLALLTTRQSSKGFTHAFCTRATIEMKSCSYDRNTEIFPLWKKNIDTQRTFEGEQELSDNFAESFIKALSAATGLTYTVRAKQPYEFSPEDVFHYIYAILYTSSYRTRYKELLSRSYPRIPLTSDTEFFRKLCALGADLVALHLLEDDYEASSWNISKPKGKSPLKTPITRFRAGGSTEVAKGHPRYEDGNVYINPARYFEGVPEDVWNFHVGGYQVCEKWLKDRRQRTLSDEDIAHYQRVVVALNETIRLMTEIDRTIAEHGGWPLVGSQETAQRSAPEGQGNVSGTTQ